jgi:hypothetical protein
VFLVVLTWLDGRSSSISVRFPSNSACSDEFVQSNPPGGYWNLLMRRPLPGVLTFVSARDARGASPDGIARRWRRDSLQRVIGRGAWATACVGGRSGARGPALGRRRT